MKRRLLLKLLCGVCITGIASAAPMGNGFTYQGSIKQNGVPYTGTAILEASLWDTQLPVQGTQVGVAQTLFGVNVTNGLFTIQLNTNNEFGASPFNGDARYLQIVFNQTLLTPRQQITATPVALSVVGQWALNGTDLTYLGGNVGIGTSQPATKLHVTPSAYGAGSGTGFFLGGNPYTGGDTGLSIDLTQAKGGYATLQAISSSGTSYGAMVLNPIDGNVGIGTSLPGTRLDINDSQTPSVKVHSSSPFGSTLRLDNSTTGGRAWDVISSGSSSTGGAGRLLFTDQIAGAIRMQIDTAGNVGINQPTPSGKLDVVNTAGAAVQGTGINGVLGTASSGPNHYGVHGIGNLLGQKAGLFDGDVLVNGSLCASGTVGTCSDARFKKNVETVTQALPLIEKLRPVRYDWKREEYPDRRFSKERQLGLIAQEVQRVAPDVVQKDSDGYLSVDYGRLTPLLIAAVKDQQKQIQSQDERAAAQQKRIDELEARLNRIESRLDKDVRVAEVR